MSGFIRFRGKPPADGVPLSPYDTTIEVQQESGEWKPLRGVCSATISIRASHLVTATLEIELGEVDLINPCVVIVPRSRWRKLRWWWRQVRVRSTWR